MPLWPQKLYLIEAVSSHLAGAVSSFSLPNVKGAELSKNYSSHVTDKTQSALAVGFSRVCLFKNTGYPRVFSGAPRVPTGFLGPDPSLFPFTIQVSNAIWQPPFFFFFFFFFFLFFFFFFFFFYFFNQSSWLLHCANRLILGQRKWEHLHWRQNPVFSKEKTRVFPSTQKCSIAPLFRLCPIIALKLKKSPGLFSFTV